MKKLLAITITIILTISFSGCVLKESDTPCIDCGSDKAYLYKIDHIGTRVLDEKITISYCKGCYNTYLEKTFGAGVRANAEKSDAEFKDVIGSGGYLDELTK